MPSTSFSTQNFSHNIHNYEQDQNLPFSYEKNHNNDITQIQIEEHNVPILNLSSTPLSTSISSSSLSSSLSSDSFSDSFSSSSDSFSLPLDSPNVQQSKFSKINLEDITKLGKHKLEDVTELNNRKLQKSTKLDSNKRQDGKKNNSPKPKKRSTSSWDVLRSNPSAYYLREKSYLYRYAPSLMVKNNKSSPNSLHATLSTQKSSHNTHKVNRKLRRAISRTIANTPSFQSPPSPLSENQDNSIFKKSQIKDHSQSSLPALQNSGIHDTILNHPTNSVSSGKTTQAQYNTTTLRNKSVNTVVSNYSTRRAAKNSPTIASYVSNTANNNTGQHIPKVKSFSSNSTHTEKPLPIALPHTKTIANPIKKTIAKSSNSRAKASSTKSRVHSQSNVMGRSSPPPSKTHDTDFKDLPDYSPPTSTLPPGKSLRAEWKGSPMDLSEDPDAHLLHQAEIHLASVLRLSCALYIDSKRRIFAEKVHRLRMGLPFRRTDSQKACRIDVNKASRLYMAFERVGWLDDKCFKNYLKSPSSPKPSTILLQKKKSVIPSLGSKDIINAGPDASFKTLSPNTNSETNISAATLPSKFDQAQSDLSKANKPVELSSSPPFSNLSHSKESVFSSPLQRFSMSSSPLAHNSQVSSSPPTSGKYFIPAPLSPTKPIHSTT